MTKTDSTSSPDDSIAAAAARWIARRDRGLSEPEQAAYLKWLRDDPRHEAAMIRPGKNWTALDQLAKHFPVEGAVPDPDLLAPPRRRAVWFWIPALAAAAAVAFIYFSRSPNIESDPTLNYSYAGKKATAPGIARLEPERHLLADGSVVELNALAAVSVQYTPTERRVQLLRGEAYFIVAKNPQRPFLVTASQVTVRAVGTAFSVGLGPKDLAVLVTEGKVRVDDAQVADEKPAAPREPSALVAGQQGVFNLSTAAGRGRPPEMEVKGLTPAEIDQALSWRNLQLEFTDLPLGDAAAEFNRHNRQKLVVADAETAAMHVGGIFRADNVAAFVSLLDTGFGVSATSHGEEIILRKTHAP